ncbi:MAG: hypothetical protein H0X33_03990 [Taibaiella sp.]|nr:hypothetical protein [Taibaiella sp.]
MTYYDFEKEVLLLVAKDHYQYYRHILPAIRHTFRERFINTIISGFDIPTSFDHVSMASKLPDIYYTRYLKFVYTKVQKTEQHNPQLA